jgi:NhaC family Na+:H+ antiporter
MKREPSFAEALLPVLVLIILLSVNVILFDDPLAGSNQIALLLAATVAGIIVRRNGQKWEETSDKVVQTIGSAMPSMLILLLIGSLAGTWLISGIVPTLIYYGLDIINPTFFLFTAVIVCAIVSVATGSSWTTIATIGVALLGMGKAIGMNEALVAGAIISGAYFGDKISPLSDTTNLASAMAGTDLFTHIRYMLFTTIPSFILTLIIFLIIGFNYDFSHAIIDVQNVKAAIGGAFNTSPWVFLVPLILFVIIMLKVPPIPSLMIGTLLGGLFAILFQPHIIQEIAGHLPSYGKASYVSFMQSMFGKVAILTPDGSVNELLTTGGMRGMLDTVWLILSAMVFGGIMESGGLLPYPGRQRYHDLRVNSLEYLRGNPVTGTWSCHVRLPALLLFQPDQSFHVNHFCLFQHPNQENQSYEPGQRSKFVLMALSFRFVLTIIVLPAISGFPGSLRILASRRRNRDS